jgi:hypothetical protein
MTKTSFLYVDREIKFDCKTKYVQLQPGEEEIDLIPQVEDTKGKTGEKGEMRITNLRLLWISKQKHDVNLSLGFNVIKDLFIRNANSVIKGNTQVFFFFFFNYYFYFSLFLLFVVMKEINMNLFLQILVRILLVYLQRLKLLLLLLSNCFRMHFVHMKIHVHFVT